MFSEEIQETSPLIFEFPKNSLGRIFDFEFYEDDTINMFEGKTLMSLLKYYINFFHFSESLKDQIEYRKLKDLTYNVNLEYIYLSETDKKYTELNKADHLSKNATYKLYKSLKYLQVKISEFKSMYQEKIKSLVSKRKEISLCQNEVLGFQTLKKKVCLSQLHKQFEVIIKSTNLELCFSADSEKKAILLKTKNILDTFTAKKIHECDKIMTEQVQKAFQLQSGKLVQGHNHFKNIYQILHFLFENEFIVQIID